MTTTPSPLGRPESGSTTFSIHELLRLAMSGSLRIPPMQRPFVWDDGDVRKLFDSLYRGFPVGTLVLWRQAVPADRVVFGGVEVDAPEKSDAFIVVDGQQRITSLVAALAANPARRDPRFEVFFDLARRRFVGPNQGMVPPRSIPVREALESRSLLTWLRDHGDTLEDGDLKIADELFGALRDYRIPAYVMEGDDERLLREVFDRVNSAGRPMTRAQVFPALFADYVDPGSPETVVRNVRRLGFGEIPEDEVVRSLLAIRGGDLERDLRDEFAGDEDPADWYEQTSHALEIAIRFLRSLGVVHIELMPSRIPLPVLAAFFHLHQEPGPAILRLLERWLWRGWIHGFGRVFGRMSDQTSALREAIRSVNPTKGDPGDAPDEYNAVRALLEQVRDARVDDFELYGWAGDWTDERLFRLALSRLGPREPDGTPLDVAAALNQFDVRAVGPMVPGDRWVWKLGAQSFWLPDWPAASEVEDHVLASHGAPDEAIAHLRAGDIPAFVAARDRELIRLTLDWINSKIEPGKRTVPPASYLLVPDPKEEAAENG